jgi:hypothetical protein
VAIAKSLFQKGASATSALAFQFASTNLVVELGLVIWILMGWQFTLAEFVGGLILIAIMSVLLRRFVSARVESRAREHALDADSGHQHHSAGESMSVRDRVTSARAWSDVAHNFRNDWSMLWKEITIGFLLAGFIGQLPDSFFNALFITEAPAPVRLIENAVVGPLIAVMSFVCSVGNIPLAAVLWSGGIGFGGVIAFIFADLIAMPLILVYRKFYGWRLTVRLVGLFYVLMVTAGLITELVFRAFGAVPVNRAVGGRPAHFAWNYTTFLDLVFLGVAGAVWWLARHKDRFGGGVGYAVDPVCGMQVRTADAPARIVHDGADVYFCADRCRERFAGDPGRFSVPGAADDGAGPASEPVRYARVPTVVGAPAVRVTAVDPVCGMAVDPESAAAHRERDGVDFWFCGRGCADRFDGQATPGA